MEKQQQVVLLQELEEQKAKLEQMLLEAQQEREDLKAVVIQKVPIINQPEVPVHGQVVTSVTPGLVTEVGPLIVNQFTYFLNLSIFLSNSIF